MSAHQPQADADFQFKLGLHLARQSVKRFFATGTIEHEPDLTPVAPETLAEVSEKEEKDMTQKTSSAKEPRRGVTLMEVLASVFVICIGLMGVLSVIPFGAFQVSKAREAEFTSNMLRNAEEELATKEIVKPERWIPENVKMESVIGEKVGNEVKKISITIYDSKTTGTGKTLNCKYFLMLDLLGSDVVGINPERISTHISRIGANFTSMKPLVLREWMTGQDDLVYNVYEDKRTDFDILGDNNKSAQGILNDKIQSSGHFTWFAMFRPQFVPCSDATHSHPNNDVPVGHSNVNDVPFDDNHTFDTVSVDLIGCYNRGAEEVIAGTIAGTFLNNSLTVQLANPPVEVDVTKTKYVFLSWSRGAVSDGAWYKVVNVMNGNQLFLTFADGTPYPAANPPFEVLLIEGTLYHKRVTVPLRDPP